MDAEMRAGRVARLKDAQAYLRGRHGIGYSLNGVWELLRRRQAKPKTGRKRHAAADPAAQVAFKKAARLCAGGAPGRARRQRRCPRGVRPPWPDEHRYAWLWLYLAVEPSPGASFVLFLPRVDGTCFAAFLHAFRRAVPDQRLALVLDGSGSHGSQRFAWPDGLAPVPLPAYSPELNPAEPLFERLRGALAN